MKASFSFLLRANYNVGFALHVFRTTDAKHDMFLVNRCESLKVSATPAYKKTKRSALSGHPVILKRQLKTRAGQWWFRAKI